MMWRLLLVAGFIICAVVGFAFRDRQYRLNSPYLESDQAVLAHQDSAYTSMTWIASQSGNYLQLRFFDKVEGGICLRPTWDDLVGLHAPTLAHLTPQSPPQMEPPGSTWKESWIPNPGTVSNSPYVRLFPLTMLLNNQLVAAANNDPRQVTGRILVVGLGSGAGIAVLAHHFPNLAITVVDIDHKVVDIVRAHFPLIHWLSEQKRADGEPRLQFHIGDARQFIHFQGEHHAAPYDAIILDAYTAGSTIPPHLMTVEFFSDCARMLESHGVLLANVIGCYGQEVDGALVGEKHRVLGGAIRSFRAAGLTHVINFPVLAQNETSGTFDWDRTRNNIVCCSREAIEPQGSHDDEDARWTRLNAFVLFPEVPTALYTTHWYMLQNSNDPHWVTAKVDTAVVDGEDASIASHLQPATSAQLPSITMRYSSDKEQIATVRRLVLAWAEKTHLSEVPSGWDDLQGDTLIEQTTDCVAYARDTYQSSVKVAHDMKHQGGEALVGDVSFSDPTHAPETAIIRDAPLFTDQRPNADILNR
jgi:hypothetical protein